MTTGIRGSFISRDPVNRLSRKYFTLYNIAENRYVHLVKNQLLQKFLRYLLRSTEADFKGKTAKVSVV